MDLGTFLNNYHIGYETNEEHEFFLTHTNLLKTKYRDLEKKCDLVFDAEGSDYSKDERERIIYKIAKSIFRNQYINSESLDMNCMDFNHTYKIIKTQLIECLPYYIDNDETFYTNRGFITEPGVIYSYFILTAIQDEITAMENKGIENEGIKLQLYTFNNMIRALKSSFILFSIGDDVHAISIVRGAVELLSRYALLNDGNIADALEYSHINDLLQKHKNNKVSDAEMDPELKGFLKKHNLNKTSAEMFLLNGWAKKKNGKPVITNSELMEEALGESAGFYKDLYHQCSEFVHEDYALANYNFIMLREQFKIYLMLLAQCLLEDCKKLSIKLNGKTRNAFNLLRVLLEPHMKPQL